MANTSVPLYAIVEILIRLSEFNEEIGNYKNHFITDDNVRVTTTTGHILLPLNLIMKQFHAPEKIDNTTLKLIAFSYQPL